MSVLHEIAAHLTAVDPTTPISLGVLPTTPDACCALFEYGGLAPETGFGTPGLKNERPAVQIVFRGAPHDYDGPRARAEAAYRALAAVQGQSISSGASSAFYRLIRPQQSPFALNRDDTQRVSIAFNVICDKELSS